MRLPKALAAAPPTALRALSRDNAWLGVHAGKKSLAGHWDGRKWSVSELKSAWISSLLPLSGSSVWAFDGDRARHFNGHAWRTVRLPRGSVVHGSDKTSARDAWAVGAQRNDERPMALHWDGKKWQRVTDRAVFGVTGIAPDGSGGVYAATPKGLAHYREGRWTFIKDPKVSGYRLTQLYDLEHIPGTRSLWTIHLFAKGDSSGTLLSRYQA
ncbi:hypothetical protein [Actinomadura macrotermitis]|uniref:Uncharacterized protein n=1 Tax=Actinomadura macrotermitis TaxID=2585200 RepID=A0A7K0C0P5_9ACTN|nr:hypothetical protein [Actinomadura macrotermitis]MQY07045.1 hypothetical protein [Actinomadura macrotermitis]